MAELPLAYNSNLHPAETVAEMVDAIEGFAGPLRERLGWERLGIDLRLGSVAIHECQSDPARLARLRAALDRAGAVAYTINAFPLSAFQSEVVKDAAYRPDWTTVERLHDTIAAIGIATALCDEELITISTCPGSHKPWGPATNDPVAIARAFGHWCAAAAGHERQSGTRVVLCMEPEPWCTLESSHEVAAFWRDHVAGDAVEAVAQALQVDPGTAGEVVARHLALCYDTCHVSVAWEDQATAAGRCAEAGASPLKVQFSACPQVLDLDRGFDDLVAMAEPRFLHQSALRLPGGEIHQVLDLDRLPDARSQHPEAEAARSHFHIPIYAEPAAEGVSSTVDDSLAGLAACREHGMRHLAVETYTWSILADDEADALEGTARELEWLAEHHAP